MSRTALKVTVCLALLGQALSDTQPRAVAAEKTDFLRELQTEAISKGKSPLAHWGPSGSIYAEWSTHSNRLIPVYTFGTKNSGAGIDLTSYQGANSPYRTADALQKIYMRMPSNSVNPNAEYIDQTNIFDLQQAALKAGKKNIILVVFDGMDWQTTRAAALYNLKKIGYTAGRGTGTHFQTYDAGGTSQYGFMVTSPHNEGTDVDVNAQTVKNPGGKMFGGYNVELGGPNPWTPGSDVQYLISKSKNPAGQHAYTDSSSSASSMTAGIKTYNNAVNVDFQGQQVRTIAHIAQAAGYSVGAITSVPISHATPAASYAHNVERDDYQDLTRDLLGLKSVSHPNQPLLGLDLLMGTGWGAEVQDVKSGKKKQGDNFVAGNLYLAADDLKQIRAENGGKYIVAQRTAGVTGADGIQRGVAEALQLKKRFLGFYGVAATGHLPFATADGKFNPTIGKGKEKGKEVYTEADLIENPTLADMTEGALKYLSAQPTKGFWLMVEAGDVDWANHDNNIDNSIGAVNSGDRAVKTVTDWVEKHSNWQETVVIVTADHGHYLFLDQPELLFPPTK
ncbi:MAG: alkaline phosphatase [Planctomycetales bacterium]